MFTSNDFGPDSRSHDSANTQWGLWSSLTRQFILQSSFSDSFFGEKKTLWKINLPSADQKVASRADFLVASSRVPSGRIAGRAKKLTCRRLTKMRLGY